MFTGLVETFGTVTSVKNTGNGVTLSVKPLSDFQV
jgi:riboflavin synthase alpha subunit